jgi:hypothetical protein
MRPRICLSSFETPEGRAPQDEVCASVAPLMTEQ